MKKKRKKYIYSEEQKAKLKIYHAEYRLKNKAKQKIYKAKWRLENKEEQKRQNQEWNEANPNYSKEWFSQHNLGYWVVYIITNYNGLSDNYCGQTQNIYRRMHTHKSLGKLNTDTYTIVKKCDTLEDALEIESAVHNFGYHGYNNGI